MVFAYSVVFAHAARYSSLVVRRLDKMDDGVGFSSTRSSVDEDEDSDRARTDSLDGYASGSGSGNRSFTDKR